MKSTNKNRAPARMELVDINKLVPYINNARTHSPEQIAKLRSSLQEFGFVSPLLIDKDYNVIAGHGRLEAARAEKYKQVPCVFVEHLTPTQKKAYILADNRLALDAGWDDELVSLEMADLSEQGFDLTLTGFSDEELTTMLTPSELEAGMREDLAEDDDADLDELLEHPAFAQRGDLWILGRHRVFCGDATDPADVAALMGGKTAQLIVTDPPYNAGYEGVHHKDRRKILNDSMNTDNFYTFLLSAFRNMAEVSDPGSPAYVFHADMEGINFRMAFRDAGFLLHEVLIWRKDRMVLSRKDYHWKHEPILYGWLPGEHKWYSDRSQTTVWNFKGPKRSDKHPTSKPLDLISYPILNSSAAGDIVIDFFGGSGSTLMAAEQTGRSCYTMELDPQYVSVICDRYAEKAGRRGLYCIRGGEKVSYEDAVEEVAE